MTCWPTFKATLNVKKQKKVKSWENIEYKNTNHKKVGEKTRWRHR